MERGMRKSCLFVVTLLTMDSCTAADPHSRVNPVVYLCSSGTNVPQDGLNVWPKFDEIASRRVYPNNTSNILKTQCVLSQHSGWVDRIFSGFIFGDKSTGLEMCFFERAYVDEPMVDSVDQSAFLSSWARFLNTVAVSDPPSNKQIKYELSPAFDRQRNSIIDQLLNISDFNRNNFLERLFGKQTGASFVNGSVGVVTSASAALTGSTGVPAAAASNAGNASLGGDLGAINSDVYYSKTVPDIAQAIQNKRTQLRESI
jgi:hypothetical protein